MRRMLVLVGGVLNTLFFAFHLLLGWRLWRLGLTSGLRPLLETFNLGSALMVGFLALVSLAFPQELPTTRVGRSVLWLAVLLYLSRAIAEEALFVRPQPVIAGACLLVAAVYAAAGLMRGKAA